MVGWLVSGAPTFVIWHHSLIDSSDFGTTHQFSTSTSIKGKSQIDDKVS